MALAKKISLSVHDLVDFLFRTGDIDNRVFNQDSMNRGSEIHATYQRKRTGNYYAEYYLKNILEIDGFTITLEGKADGIIMDKAPIIEEIKSAVIDLNEFYHKNEKWHLSQAICYAYMFLKERNIANCVIKLTYISQIDESSSEHRYTYTIKELEKEVHVYLHDYLSFYINIYNHRVARNDSAKKIIFPFKRMRKGQEQFITLANKVAQNGGIAFIEAPTGIGKTISALYPFVASFKDDNNEKIFYLTAKNTGKDAAYLASSLLINSGAKINVIYITAKEKICMCPGASCNPNECPFAKDYYTKLREAITYALNTNCLYNSDEIKKITDRFHICPFEFSLDLSLYMDIIIADYNYFFDPIVHLQRYFEADAHNYLVLVDEAHNLHDRALDMYSESLSYSLFTAFKNDYRFANKRLKNAVKRVDNIFLNELAKYDKGNHIIDDISHETHLALLNLYNNINEYLKENEFHPTDESIAFSRRLNRFLKLYDDKSDSDALFIEKSSDSEVTINLLCLDASKRIRDCLELVKAAVLFSATLSPFTYFVDVLGGKEDDDKLLLPSPFPSENFKLIIDPISVKYKDRDRTLSEVITHLDAFINTKRGNYLIFAPSFEYLEKLTPHFMKKRYQEIYIQNKEMDDREKKEFIAHFTDKKEKSVIGLAVLGGAFSEGIDLVADSLIGVAIIGVGMPTLNFKRDLMKEYYSQNEIHNGFSYAYKHPGMNKVNQAVGRLIRSESDIGAALLIDERYLTNSYRHLFKNEWQDYEVAFKKDDIINTLNAFWLNHKH